MSFEDFSSSTPSILVAISVATGFLMAISGLLEVVASTLKNLRKVLVNFEKLTKWLKKSWASNASKKLMCAISSTVGHFTLSLPPCHEEMDIFNARS